MAEQLDLNAEEAVNEFACLFANEDVKNLNELFKDCMPRLFRVANRVLHNSHDSEDAMQDGLVSALRHIGQFKGNSQFSTWLCSIIRNSSLVQLRRQRAHSIISVDNRGPEAGIEPAMPAAWIESGPDPEQACAQSELSYLFARTLKDLPANHQAIIRLCDFEGFSGKEAAQRLGLSVSALKAQHYRARQAIRKSMCIYFEREVAG